MAILPPATCESFWTLSCIGSVCFTRLVDLLSCLISLQLIALAQYRRSALPSHFQSKQVTSNHGYIASRPSRAATALELLGMATNLGINLGPLLRPDSYINCPLAFAPALLSVYLIIMYIGRTHGTGLELTMHSLCLYSVQSLGAVMVLPTVIVEHRGPVEIATVATRLLIFSILVLLHCAAPRTSKKMEPKKNTSPTELGKEDAASLLSRLTFYWMNKIVWKAFRATVNASDLPSLNTSLAAAPVATTFATIAPTTLPLLRRLFYFLRWDFLKQGALAFATSLVVYVPAIFMRFILEYLESQDRMTRGTAWFCVVGLLIPGLIASTTNCQISWIWHKIGAKLRIVLMGEIYAKLLRRNIKNSTHKSAEGVSEGKTIEGNHSCDGNILNMISADVEIICEMTGCFYLVWVTFPVQTAIGTFLLYRYLGPAGLIGVMLMIAFLPLNILLSRKLMAVQHSLLKSSDVRIQTSNEILSNIRTIKYCAWEQPFIERLLEKRKVELKRMRSRFIWWSISLTLFYSLPFIMTSVTFFFYVIVFGNELRSTIAFPCLAIFAVLRIPLNRLADAITFLLQTHVSLLRIRDFLDERQMNTVLTDTSDLDLIGFDGASLMWPTETSVDSSQETGIQLKRSPAEASFKLQDLAIKFKRGALNVVSGPSGSGKSSLLLALLGELQLLSGQVYLPQGKSFSASHEPWDSARCLRNIVAYCPQEPWILNRSIRSNIIMGLTFDAQQYEAVIYAVAFHKDLAILDSGDDTLAGENGSRLSGGQKQRVALARALYSQSRYVLLDDSLSALDHSTANHVFHHGINGSLMKGRTCIFATHHTRPAILQCKHLVILEAGQVKAQGTSKDLASLGMIDPSIFEAVANDTTEDNMYDNWREAKKEDVEHCSSRNSFETIFEQSNIRDEERVPLIINEEAKSTGAVAWHIIRTYLLAMGSAWYWILVPAAFIVQQLCALGLSIWMKHWASQYDSIPTEDYSDTRISTKAVHKHKQVSGLYYFVIYLVIGFLFVLLTTFRDLVVITGSLQASSRMYQRMLGSTLHARLGFFDCISLGQITNRFSRDVEVMDQSLPLISISTFQLATTLAFSTGLIAYILPSFILVASVIFLIYLFIAAIYINGARDFKRIEAVERSPIYQQFGETIAGYISIRAYSASNLFTSRMFELLDALNTPYLAQWASKEWLTFRISVLSSLVTFFTGAFAISSVRSIAPGAAGLALTYATSFTENTLWLIQIYGLVQQDLNSVDRIVEFIEIEPEATRPTQRSQQVASTWPQHGTITFQDYTTRYATDLNPALDEINLKIRGGERVAIVGRTGAGKSTLGLALIRGLEAESGRIEIDGTNIASLSLKTLRQAITIVPQDPKLFEGTLRDNLSPLQNNSDEEILEAVRAVCLLGPAKARQLTHVDIEMSASSLSQGQRQLMCIARGLLRRSKLLVLDEATASVDQAADNTIQACLCDSALSGVTTIAIAHRVLSIIKYDRVVVLDSGRIVEDGAPAELFARKGKGAWFRRMCEDSGQIEEIQRAVGSILNT